MSLGVSVVEAVFPHELPSPPESFSHDEQETPSFWNIFGPAEIQWEPRSFVDYQLSEDDVIDPKLPPVANYSYNNTSSCAIEEQKKVVVIGNNDTADELVVTLEEFNDITAFNNADAFKKAVLTTADVGDVDYYIIAVSVMLYSDGTFDTCQLEETITSLEQYMQPGATVILESTLPVGTTRFLLEPVIRRKRVKGGISPRHASPHNYRASQFSPTTKLIAGLDDLMPGSLASIHSLYKDSFSNVVPVRSPEIAEMATFGEDGQRMIALAYGNELADGSAPTGVDPFEVCSVLSPHSSEPSTPIAGLNRVLSTGSLFNYFGSVTF